MAAKRGSKDRQSLAVNLRRFKLLRDPRLGHLSPAPLQPCGADGEYTCALTDADTIYPCRPNLAVQYRWVVERSSVASGNIRGPPNTVICLLSVPNFPFWRRWRATKEISSVWRHQREMSVFLQRQTRCASPQAYRCAKLCPAPRTSVVYERLPLRQ